MCGVTKMSKVPSLMRLSFVLIVLSCKTFAQLENTTPEIETVKSIRDTTSNPANIQEIDSTTRQIGNSDNIKPPSDFAEKDVANISSSGADIPTVDVSQNSLDDIGPESSPPVITDVVIDICDLCFCNTTEYSDKTPFLDIVCYQVEKELRTWKFVWPINMNNSDIEVTFQNLGWTQVPILPRNNKIVSVSFFDNLIDNIHPKAFENLGNLMSLILKKNSLREIAPFTLHGLKYLEELDLSQNKLYSVEMLNFTELIMLKKLWLRENALEVFPEKALRHIVTLEFLDCSHNEIYDLTKENRVISKLKILDLSHNKLARIVSTNFKDGISLEKIDLSSNMIIKIESNAFDDCTSLVKLVLSNNKLKTIPSLPISIQSIFLQHNGLQNWMNIPKDVQYLDISYNDISTMSEESYQNLENLNIKGNHLYEFNPSKPLKKLKILDISYNRLEKVPAKFNNEILPSLDELYLDGNPLQELIFTGDITLRKLSANNLDEIESLNETSFNTLTGRPLQNADGTSMPGDGVCLDITISQCKKLKTIPDKTFQNVSLCYKVKLSMSDDSLMPGDGPCLDIMISQCKKLKTIPDKTFQNITLCYLDLSFNRLRTLSKDVAEWPSLFKGVNLQGNPWDCGCHLQWFLNDLLQILHDNNSHLLNELRCDAPQDVNGIRFVHWYKWQEKAFCSKNMLAKRSSNYKQQESTSNIEESVEWNSKTIGLVIVITVLSIAVIGLVIYLIKGKHRHDITVRRMMRRKRQSMSDAQKLNKKGASKLNDALVDA